MTMNAPSRWRATLGTVLLLALVALSGGQAIRAQEATPTGAGSAATTPRPAHIHAGDCQNLGDVVQPLTNLTAPSGRAEGQRNRAIPAESSLTTVPMTLDQLLGRDYAINVHLSAAQIGTYIACGEIGGVRDANGALTIGLRELNNSGYTGVAYLAPATSGAGTTVSVFIAQTQGTGQGQGRQAAPQAATPMSGGAATPAMAGATNAPVTVGLSEFKIDMPDTLPPGTTTFNVTNNGTITHSFEFEGQGIEKRLAQPLQPGQSATLTLDLKPGKYEAYCPVDGHKGMGMDRDVTVQ
jgi:uncharacterized cupredoxin-like copper-binding protein